MSRYGNKNTLNSIIPMILSCIYLLILQVFAENVNSGGGSPLNYVL